MVSTGEKQATPFSTAIGNTLNLYLVYRLSEIPDTLNYSSCLQSRGGHHAPRQWMNYITNRTCTYNQSTAPLGEKYNKKNIICYYYIRDEKSTIKFNYIKEGHIKCTICMPTFLLSREIMKKWRVGVIANHLINSSLN